MLPERLLVTPPASVLATDEAGRPQETYSLDNYLRTGPISRIKRHRFEVALALARPYMHKADAIDCGCADGMLLPSLSRYFRRVLAIDVSPRRIRQAALLVERLHLPNVTLFCNAGCPLADARVAMGGAACQVMFLLETLEHVGDGRDMYGSKIAFLEECFSLLSPDGVIVASVPKMVGLPFLVKHITQVVLRMRWEGLGVRDVFMASVFRNTDRLEPRWNGGHIGFNHLKLQKRLAHHYDIVAKKDMFITAFYVIRRRAAREAA